MTMVQVSLPVLRQTLHRLAQIRSISYTEVERVLSKFVADRDADLWTFSRDLYAIGFSPNDIETILSNAIVSENKSCIRRIVLELAKTEDVGGVYSDLEALVEMEVPQQ